MSTYSELLPQILLMSNFSSWRDRGKEAQIEVSPHELPDPSTQPPPPPYEETDWKPLPQPAAIQAPSRTPATPKTAAKKRRAAVVSKKPIVYHSARRSRPTPVVSPAPARTEFDFGRDGDHEADEGDGHSIVEDKVCKLISLCLLDIESLH